jgi:hypothetical protein
MIILSYIAKPWPPQDFGTLIDSLTFESFYNGIELDAFTLYSKAIFDSNVLNNTNFTPKVSDYDYFTLLLL